MPTPRFPTVEAVLRVARSQVGTTEHPAGSNETPYGAAYRMNGVAWCGIFQWWIFKHAAGGVDLHDAGIRDPQYTPSFFQEAARAGWPVVHGDAIRPGDVLFFDFKAPFNTSGIQHVAIAAGRPAGGYVRTIEGNTSSGSEGSQDNGGGVFERSRSLSVIVAAVRPPYSPAKAAKTPRKKTRIAVAAVAVTGAAGAVGTAVAHPPTHHGVTPSPAPTHALPSQRPAPTSTTTPRVTVVPSQRAKPTHVPRPPRRRAPADRQVIVGPLRYGSTGDAVRTLQRHLGLHADGVFGRRTLRKVRAAQAAADIAADGVVGPVTARALGLAYGPANRP